MAQAKTVKKTTGTNTDSPAPKEGALARKLDELDVKGTAHDMLSAVSGVLGKEFDQEAKEYSLKALSGLSQAIVKIQKDRLTQKISEDEARALMEMQKKAAESVLVTAKVMSLRTAQKALAAALEAAAGPVNKALGFKLL